VPVHISDGPRGGGANHPLTDPLTSRRQAILTARREKRFASSSQSFTAAVLRSTPEEPESPERSTQPNREGQVRRRASALTVRAGSPVWTPIRTRTSMPSPKSWTASARWLPMAPKPRPVPARKRRKTRRLEWQPPRRQNRKTLPGRCHGVPQAQRGS
jgi:hypothetical protein